MAVRVFIAAFLFLGNCYAAEPDRFEFEAPHMGTKIRVVLYAGDEAKAKAASQAVFARFAEIENALSDYKPTSEVMKLCVANDAEPGKVFKISDDLANVLKAARDVAKLSDGAFDPTIGPLSKLWRETRKSKTLPDAKTLADAKAKVSWKFVTLDGNTLRLAKPGMRLDFGGIGKGFAAEESLKTLKKLGVTSALIAASGDISVSEAPPGNEGWRIEIAPLERNGTPRYLTLKNAAVSTSGDLFQFVEINGVRHSHVLDPKTGLGQTGFRSATVVHERGTYADALTKIALLMEPETAMKLIEGETGLMSVTTKSAIDVKTTTITSQGMKLE